MNRFQIKEIRDAIETNGFFVERFEDDCIIVSHLKDPTGKELKVFASERCPKCNCYLVFDESTKTYLCLNDKCFYETEVSTPAEYISEHEEQMQYKQVILSCKSSDYKYMNAVLEEICEVVDNWCEVYLEYVGDTVHPESTLGYVDDEE